MGVRALEEPMKTNQYEAMFLLDNNVATADFDAAAGQVDAILGKHGMAIVQKEKWDERKLAYEIKGHRRATYYLAYLEGPTNGMTGIEEDLGLNEIVLRYMFIRLEEPISEHIEKRAQEREALAEDSRRNSLSGWGGGSGGGGGGGRKRRDEKPRRDARDGDASDGDKAGDAKAGDAKGEDAKPAKPAKEADSAPKAEADAASDKDTGTDAAAKSE